MKKGKDQGRSGQATVEYIMILFVVITMAVFVIRTLIKPGYELLAKGLENKLLNGDLHKFRIRK